MSDTELGIACCWFKYAGEFGRVDAAEALLLFERSENEDA